MTHFFQMRDQIDGAIAEYFSMVQQASNKRSDETDKVIKIQKVFRGSQVRKFWYSQRAGAKMIQRLVRGWLGRTRAETMRLEKRRCLHALFFHHCALIIQKHWVGFASRRKLHDYYGRKRYLETVGKRGEWTVEYLKRDHQAKLEQAKAGEVEKMRDDFDNIAGELHHLVSTRSIAGVYNPPYSDMLPSAFDKNIEQHLRDSCRIEVPRSLRRPRHRAAIAAASASPAPRRRVTAETAETSEADATTPALQASASTRRHSGNTARSASTSRLRQQQQQGQQGPQGPFRTREQVESSHANANVTFGSIQADGRYDAVDTDQRMQERLSKMTRASPTEFVTCAKASERPPPASVHTGIPFRNRPVEMREDYVELPKIRDKPPFFTALPRDKQFTAYREQPPALHGQA